MTLSDWIHQEPCLQPFEKICQERKRILAANEAPPVSSFTRFNTYGVTAAPLTFFSLSKAMHVHNISVRMHLRYASVEKSEHFTCTIEDPHNFETFTFSSGKWEDVNSHLSPQLENTHLISRRDFWIAASTELANAACCVGIGTATRIPLCNPIFRFASANGEDHKKAQQTPRWVKFSYKSLRPSVQPAQDLCCFKNERILKAYQRLH